MPINPYYYGIIDLTLQPDVWTTFLKRRLLSAENPPSEYTTGPPAYCGLLEPTMYQVPFQGRRDQPDYQCLPEG